MQHGVAWALFGLFVYLSLAVKLGLEVGLFTERGALALEEPDEALDKLGIELAVSCPGVELLHRFLRCYGRAVRPTSRHGVVRGANRENA